MAGPCVISNVNDDAHLLHRYTRLLRLINGQCQTWPNPPYDRITEPHENVLRLRFLQASELMSRLQEGFLYPHALVPWKHGVRVLIAFRLSLGKISLQGVGGSFAICTATAYAPKNDLRLVPSKTLHDPQSASTQAVHL